MYVRNDAKLFYGHAGCGLSETDRFRTLPTFKREGQPTGMPLNLKSIELLWVLAWTAYAL